MSRISKNTLEQIVLILNRRAGTPEKPWTDGKANIGCYHLSGAYGGWSLDQMSTPGGGVRSVFNCGHVSKRDLYNRISAFLDGMDAAERKRTR